VYGDENGGDGEVGHLGRAPPWWRRSPLRSPELESRRRRAPGTNSLSLHHYT